MSDVLHQEQPLTRRERERQRRRQAMISAAQAVFAEKGYAHATLEEIAERAEFGKGTLYNYFEGGKEEILFAVFDALFDEVQQIADRVFAEDNIAGRPFRDVFHEMVVSSFRFFLEREDLFFILLKEEMQLMFGDDPEKAAFVQQKQERVAAILMAPLKAAMEAGEVRSLPLRAVAHTLQGNVRGILMHTVMMRKSPACSKDDLQISTPEEAADFLATILFDGLTPYAPSA